MAPLMPSGVLSGPSSAGPVMLIIGVAVAVVCVAILVRLYRPKHLEERTGADGGSGAGGSTAGTWGYGTGDCGGGFDGGGGGGQC